MRNRYYGLYGLSDPPLEPPDDDQPAPSYDWADEILRVFREERERQESKYSLAD